MYYSASGRDEYGDFLLVVSGSTQIAPFLSDWQALKDHLRNVVSEQPGWVEIHPNQNQRGGEMQGWCRLKTSDDADAVYSNPPSVSTAPRTRLI